MLNHKPVSGGFVSTGTADAPKAPSRAERETIAVNALIRDTKFAPTDPDRVTTARTIARAVLDALAKAGALAILLILLHVPPAAAYSPVSEAQPHEIVCNDRDELAGVAMAEGGSQPTATVIAMMQIVKAESDQRGLSICALTRLTNFVSVRRFAQAHPDSWTARAIDNPPEWALDLAGAVLRAELPDMTAGMRHWDGSTDGLRIVFRP